MVSATLAFPQHHAGQSQSMGPGGVLPERDRLPNVGAALDDNRLDQIVDPLRRMQINIGSRARFHFIMETEEAAQMEASPSIENGNRATYNVDVHTEILYSPTISFSRQGDRHRKLVSNLVHAVSELSFLSLRQARRRQPNNMTPVRSQVRRPIAAVLQSDDADSIDEELFSIEPFAVPLWFPFKESEYQRGLPVSSPDPLSIAAEIASKFDSLSNDDISNLYRTFFELLHSYAKRKKKDYKQGKLKYSMFTPPWLRARIIVSGDVCQMPKLAIQDQREQRNRQGYKRMAWIMAAFSEKEACFGRYVLQYLLDKIPLHREEWNEKNENRRQHATPVHRALAGSKKRVSSIVSPRNRQVRRRLNTAEPPEPITSVPTPPRHNSDHLNNHQNSDIPSSRFINERLPETAIEDEAPATYFGNQRASLGSVNKPIGASVSAPSNEVTGVLRANPKVSQSVFDGLSLHNGNRRADVMKKNQVHNGDKNDRNGASSQVRSGGGPGIAVSSGSSGKRPPTTKKRLNRRLKEIPITIDDNFEKTNDLVQRGRRNKTSKNSLSGKVQLLRMKHS